MDKGWILSLPQERDDLCLTGNLSEAYVLEHWDDMSQYQRTLCCQWQTLPLTFIRSKWQYMEERQRVACCLYRDLDEEFIKQHWSSMGEDAQAACYEAQELSIEFVVEFWSRTYSEAKFVYMRYHAEKFKGEITPAQLPQFLIDPVNAVRELARECIKEK